MRKVLLFGLVMFLTLVSQAWAQNRAISGKVTDADNGQPLPGVAVIAKGTTVGTTTGLDGSYTINAPESSTTLVFRFLGYKTIERAINGASVIDVTLGSDTEQLSEVVVTALGIERQKKEIGYATTTVTDEVVTRANPVNVANGLQGKVAGMNITSVNNGVFENVKINLRGIRSLTGNNNPLLVLDGVPADINFLSSINPNDIDNVSVLKGSSAAAIYGPDARNGVIIVTTKKGAITDKPTVTVSHSTQLQRISFFPKLQEKFGSGAPGEYIPYENWSWGPAFDGTMRELGHELPDGTVQMVKYSPTNDRKEFFETGVTIQNDVSFAAKDFYISFQDANIKGIVPDDKNRRTGIRLNTAKEYGKFKVGFNSNYIQQNYNVFDENAMSDFFTGLGTGGNDGLMSQIFNTPAQVPITSYKDIDNNPYAQYNTYFNDYGLNPYFAIDNWRREGKREDLLTNVDFNFKATDWLNLTYRAALNSRTTTDRNISEGEMPNQYGLDRSLNIIPGAINEYTYKDIRLSSEAFANANYEINENFKVTGILGTYVRQNDTRSNNIGAPSLVVPELYNVGNRSGELNGDSYFGRTRMFSLYGSAGLSYKGWANVEVTGRNDRVSMLSLDNNSYFYPGVSGAVVLTDALSSLQDSNLLSYLKLRAAWNKTGNAFIDPYLLAATFSQNNGFPYGGVPGYSANNTTYDPNLEPEFINSREVGFESGFLNGRINLDATYFNQDNDNQIISIAVSNATGYTRAYVNAASFINRGMELDLRLTPLVELGEVDIDFRANATYSDSEITSVYEGLDELFIGGYTAGTGNYAIVGQPAFILKATDYLRDDQGRVIVDAETGFPTLDPNLKNFGRTLPKWIIGLNPSVKWKGLNFSALAEYKGGHYAYHGIGPDMAWTGVSAATARNNREHFVFPNSSIEDPENPGTYIENTNVTVSNVNSFYTGVFQDVGTNFITSASHWRLREVSLSYALPENLLSRTGFIKGATVALTGRNLLLWVPETNEFQDPDFNFATTGNTSGITTSQINPPTRTFGANVTLRF
ncbi:SusC/RagA family TonB-linked outer membrane protein [Pontibacter mangrovi]|uniref:SusC/RagA family TonB-linked outer membrane protein n=1 Tax=Pontibacter mangrovi TaxID=2589816 RepID=A0A501W4L9_9BACT|nr:SusC/RagA family TonB-linked outer membrane protein [Pontibacter mangrovi]TPE44883.1 SusC/RagA family TonB-linked outer membrane protein [Pontibacter mangrovi]